MSLREPTWIETLQRNFPACVDVHKSRSARPGSRTRPLQRSRKKTVYSYGDLLGCRASTRTAGLLDLEAKVHGQIRLRVRSAGPLAENDLRGARLSNLS